MASDRLQPTTDFSSWKAYSGNLKGIHHNPSSSCLFGGINLFPCFVHALFPIWKCLRLHALILMLQQKEFKNPSVGALGLWRPPVTESHILTADKSILRNRGFEKTPC